MQGNVTKCDNVMTKILTNANSTRTAEKNLSSNSIGLCSAKMKKTNHPSYCYKMRIYNDYDNDCQLKYCME